MKNPYEEITHLQMGKDSLICESLRKGFLCLYAQKPYMKISVRELCQKSAVARTTFCSNYGNIDMLLEEIENRLIIGVVSVNRELLEAKAKGANLASDLFYRETANYVEQVRDTMYLFFVKQPNYRFIEKWKTATKYYYWERIPEIRQEAESDVALELIASTAITIHTINLKRNKKFDIKQYSRTMNLLTNHVNFE